MSITKLLIANRGEISVRIAAAAAELEISTVSVYPDDDASALHRTRADDSVRLAGSGPAAYLDIPQMVEVALANGCDAVHPGYGFLSESAEFARRCQAEGLVFIGPPVEVLDLCANKASARRLAQQCGVPVLLGSDGPVTLDEAQAFLAGLGEGGTMMIKAVAGGGGRGMRVVARAQDTADAFVLCQTEAMQAFGDDRLYVEQFMPFARHIEIQIVADTTGDIIHLGERDCSLQRHNQKIVEFAPCHDLHPRLREKIAAAAITLAKAADYRNIGTFEFLVDAEGLQSGRDDAVFAFLEVNPRIQVEHTVTEELMNVDLVQVQLKLAAGRTLDDLGLLQSRFTSPQGTALQARINLEVMTADGDARPSIGTIQTYELPSGRGVRVDGYGYAGYSTNPRYDSLLAKLVVHDREAGFYQIIAKAQRALRDCRIAGVATNIPFLLALLSRKEVAGGKVYTRYVNEHLAEIGAATADPIASNHHARHEPSSGSIAVGFGSAAILPPGSIAIAAPMAGLVAQLCVPLGSVVAKGQLLAAIEAMKMVHHVNAPAAGTVRQIPVEVGMVVPDGARLLVLEVDDAGAADDDPVERSEMDLELIRPDLEATLARRRFVQDAARPEAVARRRKTNQLTARENVERLCNGGGFVEYGALAVASQSRRRSRDDLIENTPADGIVAGIGAVNGDSFGEHSGQCAILAYDYTVLAGTQGHQTHRKMDRLLELAERRQIPVVLFSEGGGGRPGDIDVISVTGLEVSSFRLLARLSGLVPLVGINSGRCFAGNAAMLGCCDVIIATESSTIGMGGPALVEGGGLGVFGPDEIGPMSVQVPNGVVDIVARDDAEAASIARQYVSYFQGDLADWTAPDQRVLRGIIPEDRVRTYDVRKVIEGLADHSSMLELRPHYGRGIVTALARVEGHPIAMMANNPLHLGGAIDGPASDKASRFMQLCDAHDLPLLSLCDTPGFMVGPESEKTAVVRRFARLFVTAAGMTSPFFSIVLRKAYGLGAMSMVGGQSRVPEFLVSWPNGEFGGMGLEGAIKLGLRKELAAISDPQEREAYFRRQVAAAYEFGKAANAAAHFEIDDVIDPADSRKWIMSALRSRPISGSRKGKKRPHIDTW